MQIHHIADDRIDDLTLSVMTGFKSIRAVRLRREQK